MQRIQWFKWLSLFLYGIPMLFVLVFPIYRDGLDVIQDAARGEPDTADVHSA
jgi:hypothetical protein